MTTIAYKDGVLSADSRITTDKGIWSNAKKIVALPKGAYVATAGEDTAGNAFVNWLSKDGKAGNKPPAFASSYVALVVYPSGQFDVWEDGARLSPPRDLGYFAIGSGRWAAMGAMAAGASAPEAVRIASELDHFTGGPIDFVQVITKPKQK